MFYRSDTQILGVFVVTIKEKIRRLFKRCYDVKTMTPIETLRAMEKKQLTEQEELEALELLIKRTRKQQGISVD